MLPAELTDPDLWPRCPTYNGDEQACSCWWAEAQREFLAEGGQWPGGPARELGDLIEIQTRFECREPWNESAI